MRTQERRRRRGTRRTVQFRRRWKRMTSSPPLFGYGDWYSGCRESDGDLFKVGAFFFFRWEKIGSRRWWLIGVALSRKSKESFGDRLLPKWPFFFLFLKQINTWNSVAWYITRHLMIGGSLFLRIAYCLLFFYAPFDDWYFTRHIYFFLISGYSVYLSAEKFDNRDIKLKMLVQSKYILLFTN